MSILVANLKHLHQRRELWLVCALLGLSAFVCTALMLDPRAAGKGAFVCILFLMFIVGFLVAMLSLEVVAKPFSYCLPGHRKVARMFIVITGAAVSLMGSLLFLVYPGLDSWQRIPVVCSAFCADMLFFYAGVGLAFGIRNPTPFVGFLPVVVFGMGLFELHVALERVIIENPFAVTLVGGLCSILVWFCLGSEGWARRYCAVPWIGFLDVWNREKMRKYQTARAAIKWEKLGGHPNQRLERFFLGQMRRSGHFSKRQCAWGTLYTISPVALLQWKGLALSLLPMAVWAGYVSRGAPFMVCFVSVMISGLTLARPPVYSSLLTGGGRRERLWATATTVAAAALLSAALIAVTALLSIPLARVIPEIEFRGLKLVLHPIDLRVLTLPLLVVPIAATLHLIFYRRLVLLLLSLVPPFSVIAVLTVAYKQLSGVLNPGPIMMLWIPAWLIFVITCRHVAMRRCLVAQ